MKKRPASVRGKKILFYRGNARPYTAKLVTTNMKEFNWKLMSHPPYFPDLAPFDYNLFRSLGSYLTKKKFSSTEYLKEAVYEYFASKPKSFYKQGIHMSFKR